MSTCHKSLVATKVRKHKRADAFEDNRELMRLAKVSSRNAIASLLESGISVVYLKDGNVVRKSPDNTITVVSEGGSAEKFDLREYLCQG
ncbi:hypothetical protein [Nitrincola sp. MINF-07-Sa-05]|uniref:hypothetical protein n=1 Tax=Nitrincola salilacus TaxID=3400273 RepID=UPI00391814DC